MATNYCSLSYSLQLISFLFIILLLSCCVSAAVPRLGPVSRGILRKPEPAAAASESLSKDLKIFFYYQTLDHFNYRPQSYKTFRQRYVMNFRHWGGAKSSSPILAYFGAEAPLDGDLSNIGFLNDNAARFNALLIYIEVIIKHSLSLCLDMVFFFFFFKNGLLLDFNG